MTSSLLKLAEYYQGAIRQIENQFSLHVVDGGLIHIFKGKIAAIHTQLWGVQKSVDRGNFQEAQERLDRAKKLLNYLAEWVGRQIN
jgi:hypothetical protein